MDAFRERCAEELRRLGYTNVRHELIAPSWSGALAFDPDLVGRDSVGRRTVIRCQQDDPDMVLGRDIVQMFLDGRNAGHRLDRGVIVTTGRFDPLAVRLARQHDVVLVDGVDLTGVLGLVG